MASAQVSETEREDLEESEKVQHWVERLCQTRLEQISCVENESPEVQSETSSLRSPLHLSSSAMFCYSIVLKMIALSELFLAMFSRQLSLYVCQHTDATDSLLLSERIAQ